MVGYGYHGQYLLVDLSSGTSRRLPLDESVLRAYIGGVGLATWLMLRHCPPGADPLGPDTPLVLAFSPLVGGPLTTSAKFAVVTKSPLTRRISDSLCSSRFALAGKRAGIDALVVTGRCSEPSLLVVDEDRVEWPSATPWWGRTTSDAQRAIESAFGKGWESLVIGPAGERGVRFATISHDGRHAGRGGAGAVMGAKQLKAIVVRGERRVAVADPHWLGEQAKRLSAASLGAATEKYRELGTVANLVALNRLHTLPTRNFTAVRFSFAQSLSRESLAQSNQVVRRSCAACGIGCEHIFASAPTDKDADEGVRLEYENVFALGPLCGISDPATVRRASRLCDELGMDTISAGATLALAMECAQRGWLPGVELAFGDGEALLRGLQMTARREGIGDFLAEGSRRLAEAVGEPARSLAAHVKGLEMPGYDPRTMQTLAVGLAVAARGADHNRSGAYQRDLSTQADRLRIDARTARHVIACEDEAALYDSLILCKFVRRAVGEDPRSAMAEMITATVGWQMDADELSRVARRIVDARHYFNWQHGWTRAEDTLPERFFRESVELADGTRAVLDRASFDSAVSEYYRLRGWNEFGELGKQAIGGLRLEPNIYVRS